MFAALALSLSQSVLAETDNKVKAKNSSLIKVTSCLQLGNDIQITHNNTSPTTILKAGCSDAGYGKRNYTFACVGENKYKVEWEPCPVLSSIRQLQVKNSATGVILNSANSSYITLGNKFAAKQKVTVSTKVAVLEFKLLPKYTDRGENYTYAFAWIDANSTINFDESLAKSLVANANFGSAYTTNMSLTDYYRGREVIVLAFMRNNDGISKVPGMPTEVDDVIAIHLHVLPNPPVLVCNDLSGFDGTYTLCLNKTFTYLNSNTTVTYSSEYHKQVVLTLNGIQFVLGEGQSLSLFAADKKTFVNIRIQGMNQTNNTVKIRFRTQLLTPTIQ